MKTCFLTVLALCFSIVLWPAEAQARDHHHGRHGHHDHHYSGHHHHHHHHDYRRVYHRGYWSWHHHHRVWVPGRYVVVYF